jgi:hypothetical protein
MNIATDTAAANSAKPAPSVKADEKPSPSADACVAPSPALSSVRAEETATSTAMPIAVPICCVMLTSPEASPA